MRLSQVTRLGVMGVVALMGAVSVRAQSAAALTVMKTEKGETLTGRWDAVVRANDADVPFPFEIVGDGASVRGVLFNGERKLTSAPGKLEGDTLTL